MNNISSQYVDAEGVDHRPVIINVGNFNKPTKGNPSLLSMDDVETLFHEFGHALHGLLSKATYRTLRERTHRVTSWKCPRSLWKTTATARR